MLALVADEENLARLSEALEELHASVIAVPPFDAEFLHQGLAVHFRCAAPGVEGLRVDVMSVMRGVDDFDDLWERRNQHRGGRSGDRYAVTSRSGPAKKTQRAKDWPMVRRLLEAHWFQNEGDATPARIDFWFRECRTAELLLEMARRFGSEAQMLQSERPAIAAALRGDIGAVEGALEEERHGIAAEDNGLIGHPSGRSLKRCAEGKSKAEKAGGGTSVVRPPRRDYRGGTAELVGEGRGAGGWQTGGRIAEGRGEIAEE